MYRGGGHISLHRHIDRFGKNELIVSVQNWRWAIIHIKCKQIDSYSCESKKANWLHQLFISCLLFTFFKALWRTKWHSRQTVDEAIQLVKIFCKERFCPIRVEIEVIIGQFNMKCMEVLNTEHVYSVHCVWNTSIMSTESTNLGLITIRSKFVGKISHILFTNSWFKLDFNVALILSIHFSVHLIAMKISKL